MGQARLLCRLTIGLLVHSQRAGIIIGSEYSAQMGSERAGVWSSSSAAKCVIGERTGPKAKLGERGRWKEPSRGRLALSPGTERISREKRVSNIYISLFSWDET